MSDASNVSTCILHARESYSNIHDLMAAKETMRY